MTYHWDGTSWTNVTAPLPSGSSGATLRGVTEVSASNVWAVGTTSDYKTYIIHYDGSSWSIVSSPSPSYVPSLSAVSAVSANEVYAVGRYASSPSSPIQIPLVLKYDGTQWQQETAPSEGSGLSSYSGSILQGVTAPAPGEAFAVGYFAGNGSNYTFIDRLSVKYSPTTQATLSPNQNSDGYPDPVTVTLTALASPSATIANTYFTIDGGSQQTYSSPFTVTGAGSHTITYWSVDSNSNQEATNSKTFTIAPWYDNSYLYKKQLTIDHTKVSGGANLSNFPVLVSLTDADLKTAGNGGKVQSVHGFDIIFTDGTEITKLDHEIEKYDPATGTIAMWVRVPTLSASTDTTIYMYYDNSSITSSQENKTGVWDTNYKAVWHLGETFGTTNSDSTSNGATATKQSAGHPAALSSGQIAGAQNYNGTSDYQSVSSSAVNITVDKTVEMWLNTATFAAASDSTYRKPLIVNIDNTNVYMWLIVPGSPNCIQWMTDDSTGEHVSCWGNGGSGPSTNTWYHLTGTYTSATHSVKLYVNGALNTDGYTQNGVNKGTTGAKIGARVDNKSYFQGDIDELRISNTARTAGWITTDYNNQASPASFYSVGSQQ